MLANNVIGKITEVKGIQITAKFYKKLPPHLITSGDIFPAPQINSYVKTRVGLDTIICQIVGENLIFGEHEKNDYFVNLEVRGRVSNNSFLGGLRILPIVGANVEIISEREYNKIFFEPKHSICIGSNLYDPTNKIYLDVNKLIPSHIGIFGNTGSGKSNTLAKILQEYDLLISENNLKKKSKILIFDLNDEYGGNAICNIKKKRVYSLNTRKDVKDEFKIPFDFSKMTADNCAVLLNATEKTQIPVVAKAYKNSKRNFEDGEEHYGINLIKSILLNRNKNLFFILRQYLDGYIDGISNIGFHTASNCFYYTDIYRVNSSDRAAYIDDISKIKSFKIKIPEEWLDRFEFELIFQVAERSESGINFEYISPLMSRMKDRKKDLKKIFFEKNGDILENIFGEKNIAVIQLGNVNRETREIIPSLLADLVFDLKVRERSDDKVKSILNIVIDEAHNLLSDDDETTAIHGNTLAVFEKIIKEGRKFGLFMMISSQRPSDISNTITSQLHNYFIHKLINPNDIAKIRKTVSYMGESSLNMITVLGQGECIVSGDSLYMPQYVYVKELNFENKPNSTDIKLFGEKGILEKNKKGK